MAKEVNPEKAKMNISNDDQIMRFDEIKTLQVEMEIYKKKLIIFISWKDKRGGIQGSTIMLKL